MRKYEQKKKSHSYLDGQLLLSVSQSWLIESDRKPRSLSTPQIKRFEIQNSAPPQSCRLKKQHPFLLSALLFSFSLKFLFFNTDGPLKLNRKKVSRQKIRARNLADVGYAHKREVSSPCARKENPEPALLRTGLTASRNVQFHTTASCKTSAFSQQLSVHTSENRKKIFHGYVRQCPVRVLS